MQSIYTSLKVNNEIELCEVADEDCKKLIEKAFLQNRISYYIRWTKASLFSKRQNCIICVNDNSKEAAEEIVRNICDEAGYRVKFLLRQSTNSYL
ncbi:MAG: hypothetical protein II477_02265 [Lachnospiraceae bacterium]|jgi:hypothetical protein|nr:hypothetical protein [Lachnospiraceae bacterium]MBQ2099879.1 hypothetical protein [Lachnospiraceae bacterium]MBQ3907521.1 hypothetical protein [Lachnospiraceae bacterium]MCR4597414.1 hypothetical protein [Acetatifactor sp.]